MGEAFSFEHVKFLVELIIALLVAYTGFRFKSVSDKFREIEKDIADNKQSINEIKNSLMETRNFCDSKREEINRRIGNLAERIVKCEDCED